MVYFVGAGPGDPDLITVKGAGLLAKADVVIYAGSLVNKELLGMTKKDCIIFNSATLDLDKVIDIMKENTQLGKMIVRLHTGDPSIYGAIREQMDRLDDLLIPYSVVPGVSSFCGVAASLKKEYTLPGITQTLILTRMEGRTEVPQDEDISSLSTHNATMIIFLSVHMIDTLVKKLKVGYKEQTPVAVVYKATWKDEKIVIGTLSDIVQKVLDEKIDKTALVVVGEFLGDKYELSKLYDKSFTHQFRKGE